MDVPTQNSSSFCCHQPYTTCSFKNCCWFSIISLLSIAVVIGILILIAIVILKPQQPKFSLSTMKIDSYKFSVYSSSILIMSSDVSLLLNAQNHNKVGIKYSPSCLNIFYHGLPVGIVKIPGFYQPAKSGNIGVTTKISLHCVNVSQIISEGFFQHKASNKVVEMRIIGDISVQLRLLHLTSPKIKVALECHIDIDYRRLPLTNYELLTTDIVQDHLVSFIGNSESISKNCTLALYL